MKGTAWPAHRSCKIAGLPLPMGCLLFCSARCRLVRRSCKEDRSKSCVCVCSRERDSLMRGDPCIYNDRSRKDAAQQGACTGIKWPQVACMSSPAACADEVAKSRAATRRAWRSSEMGGTGTGSRAAAAQCRALWPSEGQRALEREMAERVLQRSFWEGWAWEARSCPRPRQGPVGGP